MKLIFFLLVISNLLNSCKSNESENLLFSQNNNSDSLFNGNFIGTEEFCWIDSLGKKECLDPETLGGKWYFLREFKIINDSVFLSQCAIEIIGSDTLHSNTEGGGLATFKGVISKMDSLITFKLIQTSCAFCPAAYKINRDGSKTRIYKTLVLPVKISKSGIVINHREYSKTDRNYFD